jgi:hypothetical protein
VPVQLSFEDSADEPSGSERWAAAEKALDAVVARFGGSALRPASTLRRPRHGDDEIKNPTPGS